MTFHSATTLIHLKDSSEVHTQHVFFLLLFFLTKGGRNSKNIKPSTEKISPACGGTLMNDNFNFNQLNVNETNK